MTINSLFVNVADSPKVFSRQIQESPAVVVMERDDVIITCEKLVTNYTTQVQWILTGSDLLQKNTLFVTSDKTILLKNGMTLELVLQNGEVYKDNNNYFQNFSIIISNLTTPLNGLIAKCGEWWAEGNISQFYEHAAVIAVTPRSPQDECKMCNRKSIVSKKLTSNPDFMHIIALLITAHSLEFSIDKTHVYITKI